MKKKFTLLFALLLIVIVKHNLQAQTACNVFIQSTFDSECITSIEWKPGDHDLEHEDTPCLLACSGSEVIYSAMGLSDNSICEWTISGGQSFDVSDDGTTVTVQWPNEAIFGNIALQVTCPDSTICLTEVCIEVIEKPIAGILSNPMETEIINNVQHLYVCDGQTIEFYSNSTGSEDAPIVGYYWTDSIVTSSEQNFSFTASYGQSNNGEVEIYHKVINECGCYDDIIYYVHIYKEPQLKVDCYGTICEDMLVTYATIDDDNEFPCSNYLWSVVGGEIITGQSTNSVQVLWNDVDANGYGYLGLDNSLCDPDGCPYLTYLPIPVIVDTVNIMGPDTVCIGEWQIYEVPLWGSTHYSWSYIPNAIISQDVTRNKYKVKFTLPGIYTIDLDYQNDFLNCIGVARSKTVVVLDTFKILSDEKACQGSEITFTTDVVGSEIFLWRVYDNNNTLIFEYSGSFFSYTFALAGSYSVTAHNENYCSSIRKGIAILGLPPAPTPDTTDWASKVCLDKGYVYRAENEPPYFLHWEAPNGYPTAFDGNEYNVVFSQEDEMTLRNVDPITGCLSAPYSFQIREFIPDSLINVVFEVCANGISSDTVPLENDMLYEWSSLSSSLSIAGGKYSNVVQVQTNNFSGTANLELKRTYCNDYTEDIIPVIIRPGLIPIIEIPDTICQGGGNTFNSANIENVLLGDWIWLIEGVSDTTYSATQTNYNHTFSNSGNVPVTLSFIPDGCSTGNSTTIFVEVRPAPDVSLSFISTASGTTGTLSVTSQTGENTFLWNTEETENPITVTAPFDSIYTCTVTNENGCSVTKFLKRDTSSDSDSLNAPPPDCPAINDTIILESSCNMADFTYSSNTSDSVTNITWSITNNTSAPTATVNPTDRRRASATFTNAGTYTVRAIESVDYCEYSTYSLFTIPIIPRMTVAHACSENSNNIDLNLQIISDFVDSVEIVDSVWSINGVVVTPDANGDVTVPAGMNTIKLTIIYSYNHEIDTCEVERIFDHTRSTAGFTTSPTVYCSGTPIQFIDTSYAAISWMWTLGTQVTNLAQNPRQSFNYLVDQLVTVTLQIHDHLGCQDTVTRFINIRANRLNGSLSAEDGTYCSGEPWPVRYNPNPSSSVTYHWLPVNEISNDRHHSFFQTGFYHVFLEDSSTLCQAQSNQINLLFENAPTAFISGNDSYCFDDVIKLYGNSGFDYDYEWIDLTDNNRIIDTVPNLNISAGSWEPGTYRIQLTVKNETCSDTVIKEIVIHEQAPAPTIGFGSDTCIDQPPVILKNMDDSVSLFWSTGGYGVETEVYIHGYVLAHYLDDNGCKSKYDTIRIEKNPTFEELLTGCFRMCSDSLPKYLIPPSGTFGNWEWRYNGQMVISGNGVISPLPVDTFGIYNLNVKYNNGSCNVTSPNLVIEEDKYCSCDVTMDVLNLTCKTTLKCKPVIGATILVTNLSSDTVEIHSISSANGIITNSTTGGLIFPGESSEIYLDIAVASLFSGYATITVLFQIGEDIYCEKELVIDIDSVLNQCTTDDCEVEFIDYFPNEQLLNADMLYYNYKIDIGLNRESIEVYSDDVITNPTPQEYTNGIIYGTFSITPARMLEIIMNGEEICFTVKSCNAKKFNLICIKEVCFTPGLEECELDIEIKSKTCSIENCEVYVEYLISISNASEHEISLVNIFSQVDDFLIQEITPIPLHIAGYGAEEFELRAISDPNLQQAELILFFVNDDGLYCQSTFIVPVYDIMKNCLTDECEVLVESFTPNANLSNADYIYFDFILNTDTGSANTYVTSSHGYVTSHFYNPTNGRIEGTVRVSIEEYLLLVGDQLCFEVKLCFSNHICTATTCFDIKDLGCNMEILDHVIKCDVDTNGLYIIIELRIKNTGASTLTLTNIFLSEGYLFSTNYNDSMPEISSGEICSVVAYFYLLNFENQFLNNVFFFETEDGSLCLFTDVIDFNEYISPCIKDEKLKCIEFSIETVDASSGAIYVEFILKTIPNDELQAIYSPQIEIEHYTYNPVTGYITVSAYLNGDDIDNILSHYDNEVCFTAYLLKDEEFYRAENCCDIKFNECDIKLDYDSWSCFVHNGELYFKLTGLSVINISSMSYIFQSIIASHLEFVSIIPSIPYTLQAGTFRDFDLIFKVENPEAVSSCLFLTFQRNGDYCFKRLLLPIKKILEEYCVGNCDYQYNTTCNINSSLSGNGNNYFDFMINFLGMGGQIVRAEVYVMTDFHQIVDIVNYTYFSNDNIIRGLFQVPDNFKEEMCLVVYITDNNGKICKKKICYDLSKINKSQSSNGGNNFYDLSDFPKEILSEAVDNTENLFSQKNIYIYPNPTNNSCTVSIDQSLLKEIIIFDLRGKEIDRHRNVEFSVSKLAAGNYIVSVRMIDNTVRYLKLVKH